MRFIYSPAACSISTHIVLEELATPFEAQRILARRGDAQTREFRAINPKGKVPVLVLDDGTVITETPVILQYLARTFPQDGLLPADRIHEFEALQICEFLSNTVHNYGLTRLFRPQFFCAHEEHWETIRSEGREVLIEAFDLIATQFRGEPYLFETFSIADASLFFFELHACRLHVPMPDRVQAHFEAMLGRAAVRRAIEREGLVLSEFSVEVA